MTTAIAVLARAPVLGKVKTRLAADVGDARALDIYRMLLRHALQAATAAGCPVTLFLDGAADEELEAWCRQASVRLRPQVLGTLAQRMDHALKTLQREYHAVLLMGSDCPVLDADLLVAAAQELASAQVVIHPAEDGGFVLYGQRSGTSLASPFQAARLGTPDALRDVLAHLHDQQAVVTMLGVLWDVDTRHDALRATRLGLLEDMAD